ncbi:MAG: hypothetical protein GXO07_06105 [Crenarchaeota archaeon]|nr:hypothetical protein [Thermoproteota archaeon]
MKVCLDELGNLVKCGEGGFIVLYCDYEGELESIDYEKIKKALEDPELLAKLNDKFKKALCAILKRILKEEIG